MTPDALTTHLLTHSAPSVTLPVTDGGQVDLSRLRGTSVVYAFPRTSPPDTAPIEGWDQIPGAKGCSLQSREYALQFDALKAAGADCIFGLSTQGTGYQQETCTRLHLPFPMLQMSVFTLPTPWACLGLRRAAWCF